MKVTLHLTTGEILESLGDAQLFTEEDLQNLGMLVANPDAYFNLTVDELGTRVIVPSRNILWIDVE